MKIDGNKGFVEWSPPHDGKEAVKFLLRYDIRREAGAGQVLVRDGHFIHFFSPQVPAKPKHIIFVVDTSASMQGERLRQLKEGMVEILKVLRNNRKKKDYFSIITFNSDVMVSHLISVYFPP